jgi:hypothetical protein
MEELWVSHWLKDVAGPIPTSSWIGRAPWLVWAPTMRGDLPDRPGGHPGRQIDQVQRLLLDPSCQRFDGYRQNPGAPKQSWSTAQQTAVEPDLIARIKQIPNE